MRTYDTQQQPATLCLTPTHREDGDRETCRQRGDVTETDAGSVSGDEGLLSENATASERSVCVSSRLYTVSPKIYSN